MGRQGRGGAQVIVYGAQGLTAQKQARALLALAAEEVWGLSPLPETAREGRGKPYFPGRGELQFNLSHSRDLALCALDGAAVGVDIQVVKPWRPSLPRHVCAPAELEWLEGQGEGQGEGQLAFALLWALKESRGKQSGQGLTLPIRDIRVPLPDCCPCTLDGLYFRTYRGSDWAAAVCGLSAPPEDILWRALEDTQ